MTRIGQYGTIDIVIYSAWEYGTGAGIYRRFESGYLARIGMLDIPESIRRMPCLTFDQRKERGVAIRENYQQQYERAYAAIIEAYPEASEGKRVRGDIIMRGVRS